MADDSRAGAGTVVMLGGRSEREFTAVRELGYRVVLLDERVPWHCMPWVDTPIDVDVDDFQAVTDAIRRELGSAEPAAILTHTEPRLPLMAHLAKTLQAAPRGLSETAALNCRDKWRTRAVLSGRDLPVPRFSLVSEPEEAVLVADGIGYPVIVKPRDGAGGFGVRRCADGEEVRAAVAALLAAPPGSLSGALVEEYVDGPEFAVQTLTRGTRTEVLSVFRQRMTEPPVFVELGYDHPSGLSDAELECLEELMQQSMLALGVQDWVSHTQIRRAADGFRIIEVNARRPGGRLVEMTTAVSGVDMTEAVTRLSLGLPERPRTSRVPFARYSSIVFDEPGMVLHSGVPSFEGAFAPIVEIEVAPGEAVQPKDHLEGGVYGRIVVFGQSPEELDDTERQIRADLSLQVVPADGLGWAEADSREFKSCC